MKYFDKIYCINLDSRPDRWGECLIEFANLGITDQVERMPGVVKDRGIAGCTMSHLNCIKDAKKHNYKNVLILEDDVRFTTDIFHDAMASTMRQLEYHNLQFDILYLGANLRGNENKLIDGNLAKIVEAKAGHAYVLSSTVYDFIIDAYKDIDFDDMNNWHHHNENRMNIDVWYKNVQALGNAYGVYPSLADQRPSYSNLEKTFCDFNISQIYNKILETTTHG